MKKVYSFILCIVIIFAFSACSIRSNSDNNLDEIVDEETMVSENNLINTLCEGKWFINTDGDGMARGEGRYVDFITFHTDGTYETTQLISSYNYGTLTDIDIFKLIENYIVLYDYQEDYDFIFELNEKNNELILINALVRIYESNSPRFYYAEEYEYNINNSQNELQGYNSLEECLSNLKTQNSFGQYRLYCETDQAKITLMSGVWSPNSWQSSAEEPRTQIIFSRDGFCYIWDNSYFDNETADVFSEFYMTYNYEINNNIITISNGMVLNFDTKENELYDNERKISYGLFEDYDVY